MKEVILKKISKLAIDKIRKTKLPFDDEVGLGISWLWMLPKDHPFWGAGWQHDASFDAASIYKCERTLQSIIDRSIKNPDKVPPEYIPFVEQKIDELKRLALNFPDASTEVITDNFIKNSHQEFFNYCDRVARYKNSLYLKLQRDLFFWIVKQWA